MAPSRYKGLGGDKMKVGDLVESKMGNYGTIISIEYYGKERFVDILWSSTGFLRTCYPIWKLKVKKCK